jgi:ElaB/YqjD/DUF883 family membrane-anchored ribosome-binding protein
MGQRTDEIRHDIERTRGDLSASLDELGDRVSPRRIAQRRVSGIRGGLTSMRHTVMGSPDGGGLRGSMQAAGEQASSMGSRAGDMASGAAEQLRDAPEMVRDNVQGNPLAAGLIAFGGGLLLGSLLPPTERERQMASAVAGQLEPAIEQAKDAAQEMRTNMQDSVQTAAEHVKEQASTAAQEVKNEAKGAAEEMKDQTKDSMQDMKSEAKSVTSGSGS